MTDIFRKIFKLYAAIINAQSFNKLNKYNYIEHMADLIQECLDLS